MFLLSNWDKCMFYVLYKYDLFVISRLSSLNSKNTYLLKSFPSLVHVCRCPGLSVKVVVMDMGNHRLQSDLHIANMEYTFDNPSVQGESILIMPDPIHGLKNLRNAIIEHGAVIHWRGKSVPLDKKHFQQVILEHSKPGEACILYKIDIKQHLELTNQEKQRVDKALQLLSRRMKKASWIRRGRGDQGQQRQRRGGANRAARRGGRAWRWRVAELLQQ